VIEKDLISFAASKPLRSSASPRRETDEIYLSSGNCAPRMPYAG
jgi:hypothetical protein